MPKRETVVVSAILFSFAAVFAHAWATAPRTEPEAEEAAVQAAAAEPKQLVFECEAEQDLWLSVEAAYLEDHHATGYSLTTIGASRAGIARRAQRLAEQELMEARMRGGVCQ